MASDMAAQGPVKRLQIQAVVMKAVPCDAHAMYENGCPDCLTGEQAAAVGREDSEDLGVISDSKWRKLDPRRISAARRTEALNRKLAERG